MNEEKAFLEAVRANLEDDDVRRAYADWLDEHDELGADPRAEYLRFDCELRRIAARLQELSGRLDPDWLALVGRRMRVVLRGYRPADKIQVIKLVREITGVGLAEAKNMSEALPCVLLDNVTPEEARRWAGWFDGLAEVSVEPTVPGTGR